MFLQLHYGNLWFTHLAIGAGLMHIVLFCIRLDHGDSSELCLSVLLHTGLLSWLLHTSTCIREKGLGCFVQSALSVCLVQCSVVRCKLSVPS